MRSFGTSNQFVNLSTPYYDLVAPLKGSSLQSVGFASDGIQYGNKQSFFSAKSSLTGVGYSTESTECSDSTAYYDAFGGGEPPTLTPTDPTPITITASGISVYFSSQGDSGTPTATLSILYGSQRPDTPAVAVNAFGSLYVSQVSGLVPNTTYYFQAVASNPSGTLKSGIVPITTAVVPPSPSPPSSAPTVPTLVSSTGRSLTIQFDVAGISGNPMPLYQGKIGSNVFPATLVSGTLYQVTFSPLTPNTSYNCSSVAYNQSGTLTSASAPFTTQPASPTPPTSAPSVPTLVTATRTSITIEFDVAGVSGFPTPTYFASVGSTDLSATLVSGTLYTATATGLTPGTTYTFTSSAVNASGSKTSAGAPFSTLPSPAPTSLSSLYVIDFLLFDGVQWVIDQQSIPDIGQWFLTGGQAGQIQGNTGQSVIPYLKSLQAKGCKILVSFGGGGLTQPILTPMLSNPADTAASICYALLSKGSGTNPLGFAKAGTPWADFAFDGLDMDIEGPNGYQWPDASAQLNILNAIHTLIPSAILTAAPQAANLIDPYKFGGNGNGTWYPFPRVFPSDTLANYNTASSTSAWMYPPLMASCGLNYLFVQFYNQGTSWYPGTPGTSFVPALAMWGWLCIKSQTTLGTGCKLILGFATSVDGQPVWNQSTDASALNSAITSANALITAEAGYSSVVPSMWIAGWGGWNSPSANGVVAGIYSPAGGIPNLPAGAVMLYTNNAGSPSLNPGWTGPVPLTR
jgi:hypothetical protein